MKTLCCHVAFFFMLLFAGMVQAQHTVLPSVPEAVFSIDRFGAVGDGKTLNTVAIQQALDKARDSGGGKVTLPEGVFLCGPLKMYSHTHLYLAKGAVLRLINDVESYPVEKERYNNFITISKATDIKISGDGTIDGQGAIWWQKTNDKSLVYRRPQMLFIEQTDRIEISGILFLNPPNTHVSLKNTSEVYIHNITIQAPADSRNTDGLNISVKNCTIDQCTINTGDDNIAINFGNRNNAKDDPECRNILVQNCTFGYGHGLSVGSFTSGGLKHLTVSHCTFNGTTSAIRIKTARGRGGLVEDLTYSDVVIRNAKWPIFISEYYPKEPATPEADSIVAFNDKTPVYKNIVLKNIEVTGATDALKIWGLAESPIQGLRFENVSVSSKNGAEIYQAKGVQFIKSSIVVEKGDKLKTYMADVSGW